MKTGGIRQTKQESREQKEDSSTEETAAISMRMVMKLHSDEVGKPC